jgi:hypothetical protein
MVCIFALAACAQPDPKKIFLFNGIHLHLQAQEQLVPPTQGHVNGFQQSLPWLKEQVPLYKVVKGPGYYLYLGKPLTSLLKVLNTNSSEWQTMQSTDSIFYAQWNKMPQSCALYYTDAPSKFLMLVIQDSPVNGNITSFQQLSSRLTFKN